MQILPLIVIHVYLYIVCWIIYKAKRNVLAWMIAPIITLNIILPAVLFDLETGIFFRITFGFLCAWILNFRLLALFFKSIPKGSNFAYFCFAMILPIRISKDKRAKSIHSFSSILIKIGLIFSALILDYWAEISNQQVWIEMMVLLLYPWILYWIAGSLFDICSYFVEMILGIHLDSNFDRPYLSSTFAEFWGKRWNLVISSLLKETIYIPVLKTLHSRSIAVFASFLTSSIMHELMFFYLTDQTPLLWFKFFFINGCFSILEAYILQKTNLKGSVIWRIIVIICLLYSSREMFFSPFHDAGSSSRIRKFLLGF
jgi:hypothetical protein